jgi:hypothetical protein
MAAPAPGTGSLGGPQSVPPPATPYQSDQTYDPSRWLSYGYGKAKDFLGGIGNSLSPATADLSGVKQAQANAFALQNQLGNERGAYQGYYNPGTDTGLAGQQQANINDLANAAAGRVASPAQLQLQQQAARNAANQYGLAAALQGRSPGGALRQASMGSVATQADANTQMAILRAKEQADARNALIQALSSARGQGQNLLSADTDWRKALLAGQVGALGAGTTAAGNEASAQANAAAAQNAYKGSLIGGLSGIVGGIL